MKSTTAAEKVSILEREIAALEENEGSFDEAKKLVNRHHKALHEYNETKDGCQILFGRLALLKNTTIKQVHEEYDMLAED